MTQAVRLDVRQACDGDAEALARLLAVLGYPTAAAAVPSRLRAHAEPHSRVWVATWGDAVVGFLSFHATPLFHEPGWLGRITAMAIDPAFQRRGVGRALVAGAEAFALACQCTCVEVTSSDRREKEAHVFYRALGYESNCRRFLKRLTN